MTLHRSPMIRPLMTLMTAGISGLAIEASGCASAGNNNPATTQSIAARQDQAINDPMGYKPPEQRSVDGGGSIGTFDRKGAGQDLNDLFNP